MSDASQAIDTFDPAAEGDWGALSSLPGNPLMWVLIISELLVFGAFLLAFGVARALDPATFHHGQAMLDVALGGANTLVLVTSGWFAARAVLARKQGAVAACRRWIAAAGALGLTFVALKLVEYSDKAAQGIGLESDTFFTLYFLITGFHLMHVVLGVAIMALVAWKASVENVETGAAFWHMVDLVWLLVFPVVYLLR